VGQTDCGPGATIFLWGEEKGSETDFIVLPSWLLGSGRCHHALETKKGGQNEEKGSSGDNRFSKSRGTTLAALPQKKEPT
jgi:hypothetical protein